MSYISGEHIKKLREGKKYTQKQLADQIGVSEKTISKWETERGLPDITLLSPLAAELGTSVAELLSGESAINENRCANMKKSHFYVCPICQNVIHSLGEGAFSCCGVLLPPLTAEPADEEHDIKIERMDGEYYIFVNHPMEKEHFLSFLSYVTSDRVQTIKFYPEQAPEGRFRISGHGMIYTYCNKEGLYYCII